MVAFLRKYGTGTGADVDVPIVKRAVVDFAVGADWTPAAGDVKVSKDGGAAANIGTLPTAIAMGNTAYWKFVFSDSELQCKRLIVTVADSATKAVEDQAFVVETYGNASAMYQADLSLANLPANVTQFGGTNGTFNGGRPEVNTSHWRNEAVPATAVTGVPKIDVQYWEGSNSTADLILDNAAFFVGTADSGSTTSLVCSGLTQSATDHWKWARIRFTSGTNAGLERECSGFTPASDTLTWTEPLPAAVANGHTFAIKPNARAQTNVTALGGGDQSATDLKDFADTGYDPVAHLATVKLAPNVTHGGGSAALSLEDMTLTGELAMASMVVSGGLFANITGNLTGNVSGSVGSVVGLNPALVDAAISGRASSAEVTAIQNNTRVVRVVPAVIERPDSGTVPYRIELFFYDSVGNMEAPDAAPTIALVNQSGTDRSSRLDSATMANVSTGYYRAIYTASVGDALEQLLWTFSVTEGGVPRSYGNTSLIVDTTAVDFTAADRTKLDTLHDTRLTAGRAANLDNLDATTSSRASQTTANDIKTGTDLIAGVKAKTDNLPASPAAVGSAMTLAADAITSTAIQNGAITDAKFTVPTITGVATGVLSMLVQVWRYFFKKKHYDIAGGTIKTYGDDGTTVRTTQTVTASATDEDVGAAT